VILCVIPARGGSKGLPGKHIKPLLGKPVIGYTIEAAQKEEILDHIVVSTEDTRISECAREFGVSVIKRPEEMARDTSGIDVVLKHAVQTIEEKGDKVEIVVWLKANVPIRKPGEIASIVKKLIENDADSVLTIKKADLAVEFACKLNGSRLEQYSSAPRTFPNRQQYPQSYYHSGAIYAIRRSAIMKEKGKNDPSDYFMGRVKLGHITEGYQYSVEIDDEKDFLICELFMKRELESLERIRNAETC
jgi:CMP-N-acetylneuraminic acid synthetase